MARELLVEEHEAGYDWKSETTWQLRVCEICGRQAGDLVLVPSCEHRMVTVLVGPIKHTEVLARALDQFFRQTGAHKRPGSHAWELHNAVAPTLQALGYPT